MPPHLPTSPHISPHLPISPARQVFLTDSPQLKLVGELYDRCQETLPRRFLDTF